MGTLHPHKPVVAVIGGGISGLSVAFWLLQNDVEVIVLEQTGRPGGLSKVTGVTVILQMMQQTAS